MRETVTRQSGNLFCRGRSFDSRRSADVLQFSFKAPPYDFDMNRIKKKKEAKRNEEERLTHITICYVFI